MNSIFYKKQSSDWFFYYLILCIYGFLLNFASPIVLNLSTAYSFDSVYSSYYYWTVFLGIVAFIFVPAQIRKRNLESNPYFKSSTFMTTLGWVLVILLFFSNIRSTTVLFLLS